MSRSSAAHRPLTFFLAALLATFVMLLAPLSVLPSAAVTEDDVTQSAQPSMADAAAVTEEPVQPEEPAQPEAPAQPEEPAQPEAPVQPAAVPPVDDFVVEYIGPDCWDSSYNVGVEYGGDTTDLRVALQEDVDGAWVTLSTVSFENGLAFVYSDHLDEGETATFRVVVYDRTAATELTVLHGPLTVTGVSTENCEEWEVPTLPEDQWTLAESGCGSVTFTSRADEEVVVLWLGEEFDEDITEENYFFLAPGQSRTVQTTENRIYWVSAVGVDENLEPIGEEVVLAGEGEVEVRQNCAPAQPEKPVDDHKVPGKVQTDGGADLATVALGVLLMAAAGLGLVRRTA